MLDALGEICLNPVFIICCILYPVLVVILISPLFNVFSRRSLVKETPATSGKVSQRVA